MFTVDVLPSRSVPTPCCNRYGAIIDMTRRLNSLPTARETQEATVRILRSLFPPWLPGAFKVNWNEIREVRRGSASKRTSLWLDASTFACRAFSSEVRLCTGPVEQIYLLLIWCR